jgi:sodium/potassium-transporting ATPase subunit alpha
LPIDDDFHEAFDEAYERFGCEGERVLGFASKVLGGEWLGRKLDHESAEFPWGLDFVGLITLQDPPKASVLPAIHECQEAGIRVMMVTGDHHLTAEAIARKVGIIHGHTRRSLARERDMEEKEVPEEDPLISAVVVQGKEIPTMSEDRWDYVLKHQEIVFARTSPQQKLEIVEHCQKRGEVVAVTGDGVNDSPALKQADIGVAMGINGSDVARGAAAVILLDDNFQSLVQGIKQGRTIFDNLTKTVAYTLAHLVPELAPVLLNLAFGLPLGLNSLLILCIDLGTEVMPAVSLAYEESEGDVMRRKPRRAGIDKLVTKQTLFYSYLQAGVIECLAGFFAFFMVFYANGVPANKLFFSASDYWGAIGQDDNKILPYTIKDGRTCDKNCQEDILGEAQAAYFMNLVMGQVFHIYVCKTRKVSVWEQGIFRNFILNFGVVFSTLLMVYISCPFLLPSLTFACSFIR